MATWHVDAERVPTGEVAYWREQIESLNRRYLGMAESSAAQPHAVTATRQEDLGNTISIVGSSGQPICSVDDWFHFAPPKLGSKHWKDGRSAKELAKAFCAPGVPAVPAELLGLLASSARLDGVQLTQVWPEHKIQLDSYWGETRNADLAAVGIGKAGVVAVTLEAKADEEFGPTIAERLHAKSAGPNVRRRISSLSQSLFGPPPLNLGELRYQLLHGIAATLIFAKEQNAAAAVFIVYEFKGPSCSEQKRKANAGDLDAFVAALSPSASPLKTGQMVGPFSVPGSDRVPANIPLFIGKAERFAP